MEDEELPLIFRSELPKDGKEGGAWEDVEALSNLIYDGETPESLGEYFKKKGNEYFAKDRQYWPDAVEFYTKAIEAKSPVEANVSVYHSNRAAVHLKLGNLGSCLRDCERALGLNPKNVKAFYRGAEASIQLARYDDARRFVDGGLALDPQSAAFKKMALQLDKLAERRKAEAERKTQQEHAEAEMEARLLRACKSRGVALGHPMFGVQAWAGGSPNAGYRLQDAVQEVDGALRWRVLFLYEESQQSDWIQDMDERSTLDEFLSQMFPAPHSVPWDEHGDYVAGNLRVYFMKGWTRAREDPPPDKLWLLSARKEPMRVSPSISLAQILSSPDYMVPGYPTFYIVPPRFESQFLSTSKE